MIPGLRDIDAAGRFEVTTVAAPGAGMIAGLRDIDAAGKLEATIGAAAGDPWFPAGLPQPTPPAIGDHAGVGSPGAQSEMGGEVVLSLSVL